MSAEQTEGVYIIYLLHIKQKYTIECHINTITNTHLLFDFDHEVNEWIIL